MVFNKKEYKRQYRADHSSKIRVYKQRYYAAHKKTILETNRQRNYNKGAQPMSEKRSCTSFLGCYVAERMLSHLFKDVTRMPYGNPGYDFVCAGGYRIDVKSACLCMYKKQEDRWTFHVKHNAAADYFLCIAFDNREHLNPLHLWLIPGKTLSHKGTASIAETTLGKWAQYEKPIDNAISCCNILKNESTMDDLREFTKGGDSWAVV